MAILFGVLLWCLYIVVSAALNAIRPLGLGSAIPQVGLSFGSAANIVRLIHARGRATPRALAVALVVLAILIGEWALLFMESSNISG